MKQSTERILTTHTGSLPRPDDLVAPLYAKEQGKEYNPTTFATRVRTATAELVRQQLACGVDVVNDGEAGKVGYSTYVKDRLTGFEGTASPLAIADLAEFPPTANASFAERRLKACCVRPVPPPSRPRTGRPFTRASRISNPPSGGNARRGVLKCGLAGCYFAVS
jgi:5-methyltetrahydropteroyltriglutamate--homocysteine methyltransferase